MTEHAEIATLIADTIANLGEVDIITPASLALAVQNKITPTFEIDRLIRHLSLEHLKQMARAALRGHFDPDRDDGPEQVEMFEGGHLQYRYPIPYGRGEQPSYKLREALTDREVTWNVSALRRSATARLMHADALEAWNFSRREAA